MHAPNDASPAVAVLAAPAISAPQPILPAMKPKRSRLFTAADSEGFNVGRFLGTRVVGGEDSVLAGREIELHVFLFEYVPDYTMDAERVAFSRWEEIGD